MICCCAVGIHKMLLVIDHVVIVSRVHRDIRYSETNHVVQ